MAQLLREYYALCPNGICDSSFLTEEERYDIKNNGAVYLTGILQRADKKNGNSRSYPYTVLKREVDAYQKLIREKRALGEADHPDESVISLQNASHIVTETWWDGKTVMGKIKILSTPAGKTIQALINDGVQLGISSRGLGSVTEGNGVTMVEDDFQLICFDLVSEPSTPGAFMEPKMVNESLVKQYFTRADRLNRLLAGITG